jgi:enediyne biosynthesis protein E4
MPGGVAIFDYNGDGRPDIFFTNGANIATLQERFDPKYRNRLFRNDGHGVFTDVTDAAGLPGTGYDMGVAAADYDNDGFPDLFVAGVHHSTLYHNNGNGTFTDVTVKAGLDASLNRPDPEFGPAVGHHRGVGRRKQRRPARPFRRQLHAVDVQRRRALRISVTSPTTAVRSFTKGQPNQLFLNNGDGTFRDASKEWGIRDHVGKGMGVGVADYDLDGRPDLFVTNDASYNFCFTIRATSSRRSPSRPELPCPRMAALSPAWAGLSRFQ